MTCRTNDVEPYAYLNYLFEHLPAAEGGASPSQRRAEGRRGSRVRSIASTRSSDNPNSGSNTASAAITTASMAEKLG